MIVSKALSEFQLDIVEQTCSQSKAARGVEGSMTTECGASAAECGDQGKPQPAHYVLQKRKLAGGGATTLHQNFQKLAGIKKNIFNPWLIGTAGTGPAVMGEGNLYSFFANEWSQFAYTHGVFKEEKLASWLALSIFGELRPVCNKVMGLILGHQDFSSALGLFLKGLVCWSFYFQLF